MHILNVMLGQKRGGVEQAAADYADALVHAGHKVLNVIRRDAWIGQTLRAGGHAVIELPFPYAWNLLARRKIAQLSAHADAVIVHGNRAGDLTVQAKAPVIAVAHSRFFRRQKHFSAVIALSEKMRAQTQAEYLLPNLVRCGEASPRPAFRQPPVIGMMGRFSHEKGVDIFIDALKILRRDGFLCRARIGGAGEAELQLQAGDLAEFCGWVTDKPAFWQSVDIFVLPSRSESFPITLLEAMAAGMPCVATRCGGPSEIMTAGEDGILADISAPDLAAAIAGLLAAPDLAIRLGERAAQTARQRFDLPVVAKKLSEIVTRVARG